MGTDFLFLASGVSAQELQAEIEKGHNLGGVFTSREWVQTDVCPKYL